MTRHAALHILRPSLRHARRRIRSARSWFGYGPRRSLLDLAALGW